ncbi:MAG: helix-turn-helix domain-containing protein [Bacilli bacterium]
MSKFSGLIIVKVDEFTRARIVKGLSQRDLARDVDYSIAYVSQLERGHRHPSPQAAQQFCKVLGRTFDELFRVDKVHKSEQVNDGEVTRHE